SEEVGTMKSGRALTVLLALVATAIIATGAVMRAQGGTAAPVALGAPVVMPLTGAAVQLTLGGKDNQPADGDGEIRLSEGRVVRLDARLAPEDTITGSTWKLRSRRQGPAANAPMRSLSLLATLDAPPTARVMVTTKQGDFGFSLADLAL